MTKYRIRSDGFGYAVQTSKWGIFWDTVGRRSESGWVYSTHYDTLKEAEDYINSQLRLENDLWLRKLKEKKLSKIKPTYRRYP